MTLNSKLYVTDTVEYLANANSAGFYYRCQIINGDAIQYAEFTEGQLQVAMNRAEKHRNTQCLYSGNQTETVANSKQNIFSRFFSNLFK